MFDPTTILRNKTKAASLTFALFAACLAFSGCSPQAREARYLESGKRQMEKKDYTRASIQFRNAAKVMPKDAEPYYQLALALFALRDYAQADKSLSKAVELN